MTPMDRSRYPAGWNMLTAEIRARAGNRCECRGECGRGHEARCEARQGEKSTQSGWPVILTTAHLWKGPCKPCHEAGIKCGDPDHVKAMCQACHLAYDAELHRANAAASRRARQRLQELFPPEGGG